MTARPVYPLQIFYDGSCSVCAAEMDVYRHKEQDGRLQFVDISAPDFDPAPYGISLDEFMYEIARHRPGKPCLPRGRGVRGNLAGISDLDPLWLLGALVMFPGVNPLARLAYWSFARMRRFLPKSQDACRDGTCGIGRDKPPP